MTLPDDRLYEVRTLRAGADGTALVGGVGHGIEILDGGLYGRDAWIEFGDESGQSPPVFDGDNAIRCVPGNRAAVSFDQLRYVTPDTTGAVQDRVTIKVFRSPHTSWIDVDAIGKPRKKWLARSPSPQGFGAGWTAIYDASTELARSDRYWTGEEHDVVTWWMGHVVARDAFQVWVFACTPANEGTSSWNAVQFWQSRDLSTGLPAGSPGVGAHVVDFSTGSGPMSAAGAANVAPVPAGALIVAVYSAGGGTFEFVLGVRG